MVPSPSAVTVIAFAAVLALQACSADTGPMQGSLAGGQVPPAPDFVAASRPERLDYIPVGTVGSDRNPPARSAAEVAAAEADVDAALDLVREVVPVGRARTVVGLAGSVTTVAALVLDLPAYDASRTHLSRLPAADVRAVTDRLLAMTRAERAVLPVMHPGRVDVIGAGALVLATLLDRLGVGEVLVSEADILDGIAWSVPRAGVVRSAPDRGAHPGDAVL